MNDKVLLGAAIFSMTLHVAFGAAFYPVQTGNVTPDDRSVTISYQSIPPDAQASQRPTPAAVSVIAKETPKAVSTHEPKRLKFLHKLPKLPKELPRTVAGSEQKPVIRSSAEILKDPKDGKVFTNYFGIIKDKIYQVVRRKYSRQTVGEGSVTLVFILNRTGELENVWVVDKQTAAGIDAREFAKICVQGGAPFPPFPKELDLQKIAFNISVLFEDM